MGLHRYFSQFITRTGIQSYLILYLFVSASYIYSGINQNKFVSSQSKCLVVNDTHSTCPYIHMDQYMGGLPSPIYILHWVLVHNIQVVIPFATFGIVSNLTTIPWLKVVTQGWTTKLLPIHPSYTHRG